MQKFKEILRRAFHLPPLMTVLVAVPSFALVFYVLGAKLEKTPLAYAAYPLSAYALAVVCAGMPELVRALRRGVNESALMRRILSIPFGERYVRDELFRAGVNQYRSLFVNLLFAAVKLSAGVALRSKWLLSLGVYYLLLAFMRALLFRGLGPGGLGGDVPLELKRSRQCGVVLLLMTQALMTMAGLMILENDSYRYPGPLIYVMALHAFIAVSAAAVNLAKFRRRGSPVMYAAKALNLVAALVSVLALETALIDRFGDGGNFRRAMIGSTSAVVCAAALAAALTMIVRSTRELNRMKSDACLSKENVI